MITWCSTKKTFFSDAEVCESSVYHRVRERRKRYHQKNFNAEKPKNVILEKKTMVSPNLTPKMVSPKK